MGFFKGILQGIGIAIGIVFGFYILSLIDFANISVIVGEITTKIGEFFINLKN